MTDEPSRKGCTLRLTTVDGGGRIANVSVGRIRDGTTQTTTEPSGGGLSSLREGTATQTRKHTTTTNTTRQPTKTMPRRRTCTGGSSASASTSSLPFSGSPLTRPAKTAAAAAAVAARKYHRLDIPRHARTPTRTRNKATRTPAGRPFRTLTSRTYLPDLPSPCQPPPPSTLVTPQPACAASSALACPRSVRLVPLRRLRLRRAGGGPSTPSTTPSRTLSRTACSSAASRRRYLWPGTVGPPLGDSR
mmetsp:Transcript_31253/g.61922  ORF Transcript_31253/g.61922 Transcript_31253/m.61922 type:complete len:247 (+) Transcript_31253:2472-3212(+)